MKSGGDGNREGLAWKGCKEKKEARVKMVFWNVAMTKNKDKFWEGLREWNLIIFCETWLDMKGWKGIKGMLPGGYRWKKQQEGIKRKELRRNIGRD